MYGGINTHCLCKNYTPIVKDYRTALDFCESIKPLRGSDQWSKRPIGYRSKRNVKTVRKLENGDVAFRLYSTDAVVWHSDGTVSITGYRSLSTSQFIGVLTNYNFYYSAHDATISGVNAEGYHRFAEWGKRKCYRLDPGETLRFKVKGRDWVPVEGSELKPFVMPRLDHKKAHALRREVKLDGFTRWLNAVEALNPPQLNEGVNDNEKRLELLKAGDLMGFYETLPVKTRWSWTNGNWDRVAIGVSRSALGQFSAWLYARNDAVQIEEAAVLTQGEYYSRVKRNRYARYL